MQPVQQARGPDGASPAASTSTPPAARAACASSTSPSSTTRRSPSGSRPPRCRPLGQQFYVPTQVRHRRRRPDDASPPTRRASSRRRTSEQPVHPLYGYIYVADKYEGLILVGAGTLLDGNPLNNFLKRDADLQPGRHPRRARRRSRSSAPTPTSAATPAWWSSRLDDPKHPKVTSVIGDDVPASTRSPCRSSSATPSSATTKGVKVLDITDLAQPAAGRQAAARGRPQHLPGPHLRLRRRRQAGAGHPRHRRTPSSRRSTRSTTPAAASTTCTT